MLNFDDCSWWLIAVINTCVSFVVCHIPHIEVSLWSWSSIQVANLCCGIRGLLPIHWCLIRKIAVMYWSESYILITSHLCYSITSDFGIKDQWSRSRYMNSFWQSRVLTMTLLAFQPLIPYAGHDSCRVLQFQPISASVDGCYHLHHHPLWHGAGRDCGIRSVPRGGRPDPELFKSNKQLYIHQKLYQ